MITTHSFSQPVQLRPSLFPPVFGSRLRAHVCIGALSLVLLTGCAAGNVGLGISLPIGNLGSIGLGIDANGSIGANAGVGIGAGSISVGTSGKIPMLSNATPSESPSKQDMQNSQTNSSTKPIN